MDATETDGKKVYLLLGGNLGDRIQLLGDALEMISGEIGFVFAKSAMYETAAWGKQDQPTFLNMAVGVNTSMSPAEVLDSVLNIEQKLGRVRIEKWGARLIDIDVIFYDALVLSQKDLEIPHPQMQHRRFVLEPLAEIAGGVVHPLLKKTVSELLQNLPDDLAVSKI